MEMKHSTTETVSFTGSEKKLRDHPAYKLYPAMGPASTPIVS